MKRALFLLGFCSALLMPAGAWADIAEPGAPRRPRVLPPLPPLPIGALADVEVQGATTGEPLLEFRLAGPGTCEYTLRGPQSGNNPGPIVAKGSLTTDGADMRVKKLTIEPAPEENVTGRYRLEALCRVTPVEQTRFGPKETGQAQEVRLTHTFNLRRESVYHVTR